MLYKNTEITLIIPPELSEKLLAYCEKNEIHYDRPNTLKPSLVLAILKILNEYLGEKK